MIRLKRAVLWAALIAVLLLVLLSIYGAFLGAEGARAFFNSLPLAFYWLVLAVLLIVGIAIFRRLLVVPSLLLMHFGCILVLIGALWGSTAGHAMQKQLFGIDKVPESQMAILEHTEDNRVQMADGNNVREMPFSVRLNKFRMEYYRPGVLIVRSPTGQSWRLAGEPGVQLSLGDATGRVAVQRTFENFKLRVEDGKHIPYDAPGGSNPALEVLIERPDGTTTTGYVFEQFPPMFPAEIDLDLAYRRMIRDYISEIEIVKDGQVVAAKDIEVNHPLHYGGYHLYQHSYGQDQRGWYTVLMIVSDTGLNLVYTGYAMLIVGVFWHFWGRRTLVAISSRRMTAPRVEHE